MQMLCVKAGTYIALQIVNEFMNSTEQHLGRFHVDTNYIVIKIRLHEPLLWHLNEGVSYKQRQQGNYKANMFTGAWFQGY